MRIIGGQFGGRRLSAPTGQNTRPTTDSRREALFNIIAHGLGHNSQKVLDLFAGTGALAFEAISRGAESAVLIEQDRAALQALEKNISALELSPAQAKVVKIARPEQWGPTIARECPDFFPFDTVFCDPPYGKGWVPRSFRALEAYHQHRALFAPGALLVAETASNEKLFELEGWKLHEERTRGITRLLFYRRIE